MAHSEIRPHFNYLDTDDGQIHYWTAGEGPNLLFLHQSGNSSEEFIAMAPLLAGEFRMLAVDLPGHGRTYNPVSQPSVEDYAVAVGLVLDALAIEKTHIVANHGGGLTAMALLAAQPDRFGKAVICGVDDDDDSPEEKQAFVKRIESTDISVRAEPDFVANAWTRYQGMLSDGAEPSLALKPFIAFLDARLRPFRGIMTNLKWDRTEALAKLKGPLLMVTGEKDSYVGKQDGFLSTVPVCEHIELPGAGTFMFYDHAEKCADVIVEYLKR